MDLGTYVEHDGRPAVRFVRVYPHSIDRVWCAVTDPDELGHWFPSAVDIDRRTGGVVTFSGDPYAEDTTGSVLDYDSPWHLVFTWAGDELHFDLQPVDTGRCRLTLTNVLYDRDAAARNAAGWSVCLDELDRHVAGERTDGPHSDNASPWQPYYDAYVAAAMPSGAEIPQ